MSMVITPSRFSSSVLWTPANLTTPPVMWLNDTSGVTNSSGHATQWDDASGNGNILANASTLTTAPTITAGGQNSLQTLTFVAANSQNLNKVAGLVTINIAKNASALTLFVAGNPTKNSSATVHRVFYFSVAASGSIRCGMYLASNQVQAFQRRIDTDTAASAVMTQPDSNWHVFSSEHNWTGQSVAVRMDGGSATTTTTTQGSGNTANTNSQEVGLMGSTSTAGQYTDGMVGEVIVLGYIPGTTDRQKVEGYLEWRWGTQANLPGGHPYVSAAPTFP